MIAELACRSSEGCINSETAFLRRILANPGDAAHRMAYADWLEQRGDPRAEFLRIQARVKAERRRAGVRPRGRLHALGNKLDPDWVSFFNTLACPFRPYFCNHEGNPRDGDPYELPFAEPIGTRGLVFTFQSDFQDGNLLDPGLMPELRLLTELKLEECAYGAGSCPVYPFICELKTARRPPNGADILAALKPRAFLSLYIRDLEATSIPYPGYHPGDRHGNSNDEIHDDFENQCIFKNGVDNIGEMSGSHGVLKRFVVANHLWYVLLHTTPQPLGEFRVSRYVVLFAIGQSPDGNRLLGVVTHQICHNLCD